MKELNASQLGTIELFKTACNRLATFVNMQLFDGCRKWYWIGNEVGGACDFEECDVLNPEDMVRIIENGLSYDEYAEWRDANIDNNRYINLKSWLMGARHYMLKEEKKVNGFVVCTTTRNICNFLSFFVLKGSRCDNACPF